MAITITEMGTKPMFELSYSSIQRNRNRPPISDCNSLANFRCESTATLFILEDLEFSWFKSFYLDCWSS